METLKSIKTRRSIRSYKLEKIPQEKINQILESAMYAPSAMNYQPWHFIVLNERKDINQIFVINPHADMVKQAPLAIIICGDLKAEINIDYLVQDCSAATQNALLAIHELGLGGVWVSSYPNKETIEGLRKYFGFPNNIIPVSIIVLGYPAEEKDTENRFNKKKIHYNHW